MSPAALIPLIYLAAVLESWLLPHWEVAGAGPDLLVLVAFVWLTMSASRSAIVVVAIVGLVNDLNSAAPLGIGMGVFAVVGYCAVWLRRRLVLDHFPARQHHLVCRYHNHAARRIHIAIDGRDDAAAANADRT